jgi:hypothetical protein
MLPEERVWQAESEKLSETPENPVASARGCRGGEMLIPSVD